MGILAMPEECAPTASFTPTNTPTASPSPLPTSTTTPTRTSTATATPTGTATFTPSPQPTHTNTPVPLATNTPTPKFIKTIWPTFDKTTPTPRTPFPKFGALDQLGPLASSGMELTLSASTTLTITYGYDPLERLTAADYSEGSFFHYAYDAAGNRLSETTQAESNVYTYDDANRLASANGVAYAWDANGNLLSDGVNTYTYSIEGRLLSVSDGASTTSYTYNGDGDRVSQTVDGMMTHYVIDSATPLTMVLAETTGAETTYFLHGLDLVAQQSGTSTEYFVYDGLGSVRQVLDGSGSVLFTQAFDPYGNPDASTGTDSTSFGFTGEQTDANGLIFLRARYYDPKQGRFFTRDPFPGSTDYPATLNPYIYGLNNPILHTDPSGENPLIAVLVPALVGLGATMAGGALAGGIFGYATHNLALSGECGCDIQQQALSMTKWEWAGVHALSGGLIAGTAIALAAPAAAGVPAAMILVGGVGTVVSVTDFFQTAQIMKNETGLTPCIGTRLLLDAAGIALSVIPVIEGVKAWRASGSALRIVSPVAPTTGRAALDELHAQSRPGSGPRVREAPRMNAEEWFYRIADTKTIESHPNPNISGGFKGKVPGGGEIFYRPKTSYGDSGIDISNVPGYPSYLKYHFPFE
jgi:RHS repeat-associated protein